MTPLTKSQKSALRRKIIQSGQTIQGLDDAALVERARALGADDIPGETGTVTPPGGAPVPGEPTDTADAVYAAAQSQDTPDESGDESGPEKTPGEAEPDNNGEPAETHDADDNGDPDAPIDGAESESDAERDQRQQSEREQRGQDDDPLKAMIREIANVEIDGREYSPQLSRLRDSLAAEVKRRRKLARRTARAVRLLDKRIAEAPAATATATATATPAPRAIEIRRPGEAPKTIEGAHPQLHTLVTTLNAGIHPLLVGPAGSGKSTLAEQAADALNLPFYSTGAVFQKYELTGFVDAGGNYAETLFYKVFRDGGVYLWDELDASMPQPLVAFNQGLSNGVMPFPNGEMVKQHPDAYFIAAANTNGTGANRTYVGRNALDAATLDRYFQIEIHYDHGLEDRLALAHMAGAAGLDSAEDLTPEQRAAAEAWTREVRHVRDFVAANNWGYVVSPRAVIQGVRLLASGLDIETIRAGTIHKHLSPDQKRQLDASA